MRDLRDVLMSFEALHGAPAVLATVVRVEGSAYRRPGARMLRLDDGRLVGLLSGGCLEADLAERGREVAASGTATLASYDARHDADLVFGLGSGCNGRIDVWIEPLPETSEGGHLAFLGRTIAAGETAFVATVLAPPRLAGRRLWWSESGTASGTVSDPALAARLHAAILAQRPSRRHQTVMVEDGPAPLELLVERIRPFPRLAVFGGGPDARPVARLALELGFDVTVVDHRPAFVRPERFPGARVLLAEAGSAPAGLGRLDAALVMSHHFGHDRDTLGRLLAAPPRYLGVLGPRARTARLLHELAKEGIVPDAATRPRLFAPVGLDLGAETPEEIALSILAEIQAVLAGRHGGSLRDRAAPIHGSDTDG